MGPEGFFAASGVAAGALAAGGGVAFGEARRGSGAAGLTAGFFSRSTSGFKYSAGPSPFSTA
jgi:hypothetical protein